MPVTTHTRTETHEERFARLLREAIEVGKQAQGIAPSRELSVAVTEAETALLWANEDVRKKGGNAD